MLSSADRSKIEKIANLLASPFDGERSNAGALLARMAADRRVTVSQLLNLAQAPAAPEPQPPSSSRLWDEGVELLDQLALAVNFTNVLSELETAFAGDVARRYGRAAQLSQKQRTIAEKIVCKARRAALSGVEPDWNKV